MAWRSEDRNLYWVATRWSGTQSWVLQGVNAGPPKAITDGTRPAEGYAVAVSGSNVYVGGFESSGGTAALPVAGGQGLAERRRDQPVRWRLRGQGQRGWR